MKAPASPGVKAEAAEAGSAGVVISSIGASRGGDDVVTSEQQQRHATAASRRDPQPTSTAVAERVAGTASAEFVNQIAHEFARRHLVLVTTHDDAPHLWHAPGTAPWILHNIAAVLGRDLTTTPTDPEPLASAIDAAYLAAAGTASPESTSSDQPVVSVTGAADDLEAELALAVKDAEQDLLVTEGKAPAIRLVDLILFEAVQRSASDIHIQPVRSRTLVRLRLDGVLHTVRELPLALAASVVSRIKIMGRMDVAEQRAPQDGRASVSVGGTKLTAGPAPSGGTTSARRIDLRISTLPSTYGERVVIRLLDPSRSTHLLSFKALGMPLALERRYLAMSNRSSGIVLSTGPTGSGKTTTLYTTLAWVSSSNAGKSTRGCELNMMTIEDPVEFDLSTCGLAASQTQVDPKKQVTFATGLRHILRQDPDVIMVGEIRDEETARIAVQASLTGHLVLSTLHTNDAASAVVRLIDLGVEPFLVASSLAGVLAQRLVRCVHQPCRGQGCPGCLGTGFRGRTGVFELLGVDAAMRELIINRSSSLTMKAAAERAGMVNLKDAGLRLVAEGLTTHAELSRVIETLDEVIEAPISDGFANGTAAQDAAPARQDSTMPLVTTPAKPAPVGGLPA